MLARRLCRAPFADLNGEGARRYGVRWNAPGRPAVYAAADAALAVLEVRVHPDLTPDLRRAPCDAWPTVVVRWMLRVCLGGNNVHHNRFTARGVLAAVDLDQRRPDSNAWFRRFMRTPRARPVLTATGYFNTGVGGSRRGRRVEYSATPAVPCDPCVEGHSPPAPTIRMSTSKLGGPASQTHGPVWIWPPRPIGWYRVAPAPTRIRTSKSPCLCMVPVLRPARNARAIS